MADISEFFNGNFRIIENMNRKEQLKTVLMAVAVVSLTACSEKKVERQVEPVAVETEQVVTAVFGIITLMGMIMRNEILIFEHADGLRKQGWTARDAAFNAGRRRMVPIFLTTATTAMGVVPMIIAATSFWMPVGVTICAGGIGSLIMVVIMLPVIYWKLFEKKNEKQ